MGNILVTGATGFVGSALLPRLARDGHAVRAAVRQFKADIPAAHMDTVEVGDLSATTDWSNALAGIDVVVHCAARVHAMNEDTSDWLAAYRQVNVDGTLALARQAAQMGVQRFVFLSSITVNGNINHRPFIEQDKPAPLGPYAQSKWEAEHGLRLLCQETGMELVIIRPPLVYGPGVAGNFDRMVRWTTRGIPLPLGAARNNRRSLVALDNLVDFIALCVDRNRSPNAANELFLISDGQDVSTAELLRSIARTYHVKARLLSVPLPLLRLGASLLGKSGEAHRLLGSLMIDNSKARQLLGWQPVVSMDDQLETMVKNASNS